MSVVAAVGASHAPGIVAWKDRADADSADRFYEGYREAGRRLADAKSELVVLVTAEHFTNFFEVMPAFYLNIGEGAKGPVEHWLGIDQREVPGHPDAARTVLDAMLDQGFDLAYGHDMELDHGAMVPLELLGVAADTPVLPIIVNCLVQPMPTHRRCRDFGAALGHVLEGLTSRVALVAAGGLSHWPGMAEAGKISPAWDHAVLDGLRDGNRDVLWEPPSAGADDAGPGAEELRAWAVVGAACDRSKADVLAYEPVSEWSTGCAVVDLMA